MVDTGDAERNRETRALALAALNGVALHRSSSGDVEPAYIACKWNLVREFTTLDAVEIWLDQITGADHRGRREGARQELIDVANRRRDRLDEATDYLRDMGRGR